MKLGKRYAIMCRVSTADQKREGYSLEVQEESCNEYVARLGGKVVHTYSDQESASTEDRVVLPKVLADAGQVYTDLVFLEPKRLSRNPATMFDAMSKLTAAGVQMHVVHGKGAIDIEKPQDEFHMLIEGTLGRYQARESRAKSIASRLYLLRKGVMAAGRPPFGRNWIGKEKRFEIIPERQAQLRRTYDLVVKHRRSLAYAAKDLEMSTSSLRKGVKQAALTEFTQRLNGETFTFKCPPLLKPEEQAALEKRIRANMVVRPHVKGTYLLQGLVRCETCGAHMSGQSSMKYKGDTKYRYAIYRHPPATYKDGCTWQVPVGLLDDDVLTGCAEVVKSGSALRGAIRAELEHRHGDVSKLEDRRDELKGKIKAREAELDSWVDVLARLDAGKAIERTKARIAQGQRALKADEAELQRLEIEIHHLTGPAIDAEEVARKLRSLYWGSGAAPKVILTTDQRRSFVRAVIGEDDKLGVFVRMHRRKSGKLKDVFWKYRIKGLIADIDNYLANEEAPSYPAVAARPVDSAGIKRLAGIATTSRGVGRVQTRAKGS